jgi:Dimerisation domain
MLCDVVAHLRKAGAIASQLSGVDGPSWTPGMDACLSVLEAAAYREVAVVRHAANGVPSPSSRINGRSRIMAEERGLTPATRPMTPVEAIRRLWEMGLAYVYSQPLFAAIDLGLFDALGRGAATPEDLARQLHIHPEGCRRLLVALRQLGLVERDQHVYTNSALGAYLTTDSPYPLHGLFMVGGAFGRLCDYRPAVLRE